LMPTLNATSRPNDRVNTPIQFTEPLVMKTTSKIATTWSGVLATSIALGLGLGLGLIAGPASAQNTPFDKAMQETRAALPTASPAARPSAAPAATAPNDGAPPLAAAPVPRAKRHSVAPMQQRYEVRAANQSFSGEPALSCRTINWKKGDIIRLQAQPYKQVHIALPENGIDVIMGDKELWALDWINNRIFLKPTSRSNEGRSTTISAIGQSGNAYEFVVHRIAEAAEVSHCVYINAEGGLLSRAAWTKPTDRESEIATVLGREIANLREQNETAVRAATEGAANARKKVNTAYSWRKDGLNRWGGAEVEAVHDDGRFTYVRLKEDNQGLVAVSAEIDGKAQLLEYGYDAPSRTYQISGIFPKLVLRAGEQAMTITRKTS
jgi:type IV secretory pathway VirB9-like protein